MKMIAYKTYAQCPVNLRPLGINLNWIYQSQTCEIHDREPLQVFGFIVVTEDEFNELVSSFVVDMSNYDPRTSYQKDYDKYIKRATVKDKIIAEMAAENMQRIRTGVWTINQLIELTQDIELKNVLDDVNTLSFELAASKVMSLTNPLLTNEIKMGWVVKLQYNF